MGWLERPTAELQDRNITGGKKNKNSTTAERTVHEIEGGGGDIEKSNHISENKIEDNKNKRIQKDEKMSDDYSSKIRKILNDSGNIGLETKLTLINDIILQCQKDKELELLRKNYTPANQQFLMGGGVE